MDSRWMSIAIVLALAAGTAVFRLPPALDAQCATLDGANLPPQTQRSLKRLEPPQRDQHEVAHDRLYGLPPVVVDASVVMHVAVVELTDPTSEFQPFSVPITHARAPPA